MAGLGGEAPVDVRSQQRVVDALQRTGHLRLRSSRQRLVRPVLLCAAAVMLFVGGGWWGRKTIGNEGVTGDAPRFALFLLEDSTFLGTRTVGHDSLVAEYSAWAGRLAESGNLVLGEELGADTWPLGTALLANPSPGQITGFFVVTARTESEALAIARSCPHLRYGGGIVVRPIEPTYPRKLLGLDLGHRAQRVDASPPKAGIGDGLQDQAGVGQLPRVDRWFGLPAGHLAAQIHQGQPVALNGVFPYDHLVVVPQKTVATGVVNHQPDLTHQLAGNRVRFAQDD